MLNIIICDDDEFTLHMLTALLERAISQSNIEAKLVCLASTGQELLQFIQKGGNYLYFLDFDFGKEALNGIDLVRQIYQIDPIGKIVFVTSHGDKGMDILRSGVRPLGFIEKSVDQGKMVREYIRYLQMAASTKGVIETEPCVELSIGIDETVWLAISDISYVDTVKTVAHSICYHTFDGSEITVRDTLEHAHEQLGETFIRCHRSVFVNRIHILSLQNGMIKLSNGEFVVCALGKRRMIQELCLRREGGYK